MFPVTAGASVFVAALQNMLLLDLFHNRERRLLSTPTHFKSYWGQKTSWKSIVSHQLIPSVYLKKKNYSVLDASVFSWVATDCPHPLKKTRSSDVIRTPSIRCLFFAARPRPCFDRHAIVLESKQEETKESWTSWVRSLYSNATGAAVDRGRPVLSSLLLSVQHIVIPL